MDKLIFTNSEERGSFRIDLHIGGENVGYLVYEPLTAVWLDGLYVAPKWRRRGFARRLMNNFLSKEGRREIKLHVSPFNKSPDDLLIKEADLIRFYKSFGFVLEFNGDMTRPPI